MRTEHSIEVNGADNGFTIRVGCKLFVFKDGEVDEAMADLKTLLTEGHKGERKLRDKYLFHYAAEKGCDLLEGAPGRAYETVRQEITCEG